MPTTYWSYLTLYVLSENVILKFFHVAISQLIEDPRLISCKQVLLIFLVISCVMWFP